MAIWLAAAHISLLGVQTQLPSCWLVIVHVCQIFILLNCLNWNKSRTRNEPAISFLISSHRFQFSCSAAHFITASALLKVSPFLFALPYALWHCGSDREAWLSSFLFFSFFFFLLLNACGIYFDVERCLLAFKDAMPCGPLWCDLTEDEKPKLRSWAPRAEHLKPNSHEREVQCTPVALLSPVRRCISMKCTGSLLQHGDAELQAAPDNAGDHSEMELIHADKRLGFMVRPKHEWKEGWRALSLDNIVIKWTRFYECHHLCLCTDDKEELNHNEMSGIKSPRPERHWKGNIYLDFWATPGAKLCPFSD